MNVGDYVLREGRKSWVWGSHDCCTYAAGWCLERGHDDPMAFIRGRYDSETSALRRIAEGGGLVALWSRGMKDAGIPTVDDPELGDVGIVRILAETGTDQACGIFLGERWGLLGLSGLISTPATTLRVWRV